MRLSMTLKLVSTGALLFGAMGATCVGGEAIAGLVVTWLLDQLLAAGALGI